MIGLFGSALSPVVSYITFGMRFPLLIGILLGNLAGIAIGLLLPPLAAQTLFSIVDSHFIILDSPLG